MPVKNKIDIENFCYLAGTGNTQAVREFLESRGTAGINVKDLNGETALMRAACGKHADTVALLLEKGADVHIVDKDNWTALLWAATGDKDIVAQLLDAGADINKQSHKRLTALSIAARSGNDGAEAVVALLLERGADIRMKDRNGETVLTTADHYDRTIGAMIKNHAMMQEQREKEQAFAANLEAITKAVAGGLAKDTPLPRPFRPRPPLAGEI